MFCAGEHLFTAVAKAHQADIGNSIPTTYHAAARDIYEEGALIFPCVRVQKDYRNVEDIIRMCRRRIRVPDQWYGDFLAAVGAARIGERRLDALTAQYGNDTIKRFTRAWLDYAERRMVQEVRRLPAGRLVNTTQHDPIPGVVPDGIPLKVVLEIDPAAGMIDIDLSDNPDCLPCGLNESEACAINNVMTGVFNCLDPDMPHNAGTFRRVRVHLRENCVVGIPRFPHSCSVATTNVGDRLVNATQSAFAGIGDGWGLAEGNTALTAGCAVVSGQDARYGAAVHQPDVSHGWWRAGISDVGRLDQPPDPGRRWSAVPRQCRTRRTEVSVLVKSLRLMPDSGGAGRLRGAPGTEVVYGPRQAPLRVVAAPDGWRTPPRGVRGGHNGTRSEDHILHADGRETKVEGFIDVELQPGNSFAGVIVVAGAMAYRRSGSAARTARRARRLGHARTAEAVYGIVFTRDPTGRIVGVDDPATAALRGKR